MTLVRAILLVAAVSLPALSTRADLYFVDVGGTDSSTGHMLRVTGTIDVDVATDVIADSSLSFHHESDPPRPLPQFPNVFGDGVDFVDSSGMLYVAPRPGDGIVAWILEHYQALHVFTLFDDDAASIDPVIQLAYQDLESLEDDVLFVPGSGNPVKLGPAVPEASALTLSLVGLGVAGASRWRKRRMLNSAVHS